MSRPAFALEKCRQVLDVEANKIGSRETYKNRELDEMFAENMWRHHQELHFDPIHRRISPLLYRSLSKACPPFCYSPADTMANALGAVYKYAIPIAIGVSFAQSAIYDVKGGTRAVIFDRLSGVKDQVMNEGTHFLIPWLQKSIIYDVRTKPRNISTTTGSKDLQMVSLTLRVLHRPDVKALPKIYQV